MFKSTIRIDEATDANIVLAKFERECVAGRAAVSESVRTEVERIVRDLESRGDELLRVGSSMHVEHTAEGEGYRVRIVADFVAGKRSVLSRLKSALVRN